MKFLYLLVFALCVFFRLGLGEHLPEANGKKALVVKMSKGDTIEKVTFLSRRERKNEFLVFKQKASPESKYFPPRANQLDHKLFQKYRDLVDFGNDQAIPISIEQIKQILEMWVFRSDDSDSCCAFHSSIGTERQAAGCDKSKESTHMPHCNDVECSFQFKLGDLSLDSMCRAEEGGIEFERSEVGRNMARGSEGEPIWEKLEDNTEFKALTDMISMVDLHVIESEGSRYLIMFVDATSAPESESLNLREKMVKYMTEMIGKQSEMVEYVVFECNPQISL